MKNSELFKSWGTFHKGMDASGIEKSFASHLEYSLSKDQYTATVRDLYHALALTCRDRLIERWIRTQQTHYKADVKRIYYLSAEYLIGRLLVNNLINLGMYEETVQAMKELSIDIDRLVEEEPDAGLGNGGLGRLAACFMDSLATLELPAIGYGIRYEFGIFEQFIRGLAQVEAPDSWLKFGNPWEIARPERHYVVRFYGYTKQTVLPDGRLTTEWLDTDDVIGIAYDTPVDGYDNNTVNTLRLWSARASKEFDLQYFQHGDYLKAVEEKNYSENISKVLYPNDNIFEGRELRLKQQYFFTSCSIQDIIRRYLVNHTDFSEFPDKVAIQLNDTHPSLAIPELMRIFLDDYGMRWEDSWDITTQVFAYTNHTLLSEALERWPVSMFETILPRHLQIIYEINRRFMRDVSLVHPGDYDLQRRTSLIEEAPEKKVRMAHLAIVGSHSVNGVSKLHTDLLTNKELADFNLLFPGRFNNKTNGVTPRRWLLAANPELSSIISRRIGTGWIKNFNEIGKLESFADDSDFAAEFVSAKHVAKMRLASVAHDLTGFAVDPDSIFDVQVKRIHEYKRQLLNILHVVSLWLRMKDSPARGWQPRTFIFGGKAAPAYIMAKLIIRLICHVGEMLNRDPATSRFLKVIFLPNYRVSLAEKIFPASDVSEQISTAGYEASGTGNMKFALNGAVTLGTLDGANIEIKEEVGDENIFIFGMTAAQVEELRSHYDPWHTYTENELLRRTLDLIRSGFFNPEEPELFHPLVDSLLTQDSYFVLADFQSYLEAHEQVEAAYADHKRWNKMAILNVARSGKFSSDRTILEYNRDIWKAAPCEICREDIALEAGC
ncbi:MAG: glycogen/starch/alpha-glucan phosphorylase [bacterium]|jgi:starch phosphorylase